MANQIIEQQAEAQVAKQECRGMQFIVAEEWGGAGECCVAPLPAQAAEVEPPALVEGEEQGWGGGRCVA
jgi:hypothetical protein